MDNLRSVVTSAREAGIHAVFLPHRRWEPGDYETWAHPNPTQRNIKERHTFAHAIVATGELVTAFKEARS
ncbi:hypothetical protein [Streptosporangium roseum]|uniref:hypothetical protein n=1 Tax=Streptosporangium roseum TaxID=2001 RepID=UPI0033238EDA